MTADGSKAHEAAMTWWGSTHSANARRRGFAICDRCNGQIRDGEGYLCAPGIAGLGGSPDGMSGSPDMLCESCYTRHPAAAWVWKQPPAPARKWWEVWK